MLIAGIIVYGGAAESARKLVEIFREDGTICTLPNLPAARSSHTQSGWVICGGADGNGPNAALKTCTTFEDGAWVESHNLTKGRKDHISWETSTVDIILIGGTSAPTLQSTELLSHTSSVSSESFSLADKTRYAISTLFHFSDNCIYIMFRKACGIVMPETDHIVITGGQLNNGATNQVQIYNTNGVVSSPELPPLNTERFQHACAYYYDSLGQIVSYTGCLLPLK